MSKVRVLLVTPSFDLKGGVVEFNKMLIEQSNAEFIVFQLTSGKRKSNIFKLVSLLWDYLRFVFILSTRSVDMVHLNPSLAKNALKRDGYFTLVAKIFRKKVYIHWHGWNPANEHLLYRGKRFLKRTFFKADHIKFLSSQFLTVFKDLGFSNKLSLGSTFIDDALLKNNQEKAPSGGILRILFLSTISVNKGIYTALEAFKLLKERGCECELIVAGTGNELEHAKLFVQDNRLEGVRFIGHVSGAEKASVFQSAHIYLFPSLYEGMPTSLLEAMGFGLTLITSDAGAIKDFFVQDQMGRMIVDGEPTDYSNAIQEFRFDNKMNAIKAFNQQFAHERFMASAVIARIDDDYDQLARAKEMSN